MSKKKGNVSASSQAAGTEQKPKLKKELRKDMRVMFQQLQRVDKNAILDKYFSRHPDKMDYITTVVDK